LAASTTRKCLSGIPSALYSLLFLRG
jgi:hypothetical protein